MRIFVRKNFSHASRILLLILQLGIFYRSLLSYLKRAAKVIYPAVIDALLLLLSFLLAVYLRFHIIPNRPYRFIIVIYVLVWLSVFVLYGIYTSKNRFSVIKTFNALFIGLFINSAITYFFKEYAFSREVIIMSMIWALVLLIGWRSVVNIYRFFVDKNILLRKINLLVVGGRKLTEDIEEKLVSRYNIIYYNNPEYNFEEIKETIIIGNINEVVFSGDIFSNRDILKLMWTFKERNVKFKIIPSGNELILSKLRGDVENPSLIEIEYNINNKLNIFSKWLFDFLLATILLPTVYPVVKIYSFIFGKEDSRFVRKVSMLPYIWINKYSFVGVPVWYEDYDSEYFGKRGMTGLLQLHSDGSLSKEDESNYILYYAKNQSLLFDIEILLKSFILNYKK